MNCALWTVNFKILFPRHLLHHHFIPYRHHMGDKLWYVLILCQYEDYLQVSFLAHLLQNLAQLLASLFVQTYEGVVHYQHSWVAHQRATEHEFSQLAWWEQYDVFVQQIMQVEDIIEVLLKGSPLLCVLAWGEESILKQFATGGSALVYLRLVPPLLQVVCPVVVASVCIAKGDVLYVVWCQSWGLWREVILHILHQQRVGSCQYVNKESFAPSIWSHYGDVLALVQLKVDGLSHPPFRHSGYSVVYLDDRLTPNPSLWERGTICIDVLCIIAAIIHSCPLLCVFVISPLPNVVVREGLGESLSLFFVAKSFQLLYCLLLKPAGDVICIKWQ